MLAPLSRRGQKRLSIMRLDDAERARRKNETKSLGRVVWGSLGDSFAERGLGAGFSCASDSGSLENTGSGIAALRKPAPVKRLGFQKRPKKCRFRIPWSLGIGPCSPSMIGSISGFLSRF